MLVQEDEESTRLLQNTQSHQNEDKTISVMQGADTHCRTKEETKREQPFDEEPPKEIVHKVCYGDSLEGLSLTYQVSIGSIRNRNNLHSDDIYYLKELIIPNPKMVIRPAQMDEASKIAEFMAYQSYSQKCIGTAKYYLLEAQWDIQAALKEYREDLAWQKNNKPQQRGSGTNKGVKRVVFEEIQMGSIKAKAD